MNEYVRKTWKVPRKMPFTVDVDSGLCMGAQRCTYLKPEVFNLDDDGIAEVTDPQLLTEEQADFVAEECPNMAISVVHGH